MRQHTKQWGRTILYYCPKIKKEWQRIPKTANGRSYEIYSDMPTYGLERKELDETI